MTSLDLRHGDCLQVLQSLPDGHVDSIVTDPPYGIAFMGKEWDSFKATNEAKSQVVKGLGTGMRMTTAAENRAFQAWCEEWAKECYRVLKPGGWLLAFGGSRMYHRLAAGVEDAGFELRDTIAWVYATGFPKSMDISKAIDKAAGAEREVVGVSKNDRPISQVKGGKAFDRAMDKGQKHEPLLITAPATPEAKQWEGWGTALKPALEPITLARKPLIGTVAANVLEHGTGALNIDGCRVGDSRPPSVSPENQWRRFKEQDGNARADSRNPDTRTDIGRFPANLIHDGSEEVAQLFGDAQRFFYVPKCSKVDREDGNVHPTVKPTDLMAYLCRLVTPPGGIVLDPFMGSGSTGKAAIREGFGFIGIEREAEYFAIAQRRVQLPEQQQLSLVV